MRTRSSTVGVLLIVLGVPTVLRADGKYWPERAYEAPPRIPAQSAVLAFRAGVETLVIESSAESPSRSLGWIIPVPSEPEAVEEIRPGLFESLAYCLGPTIVHDLTEQVRSSAWFFACLAVCALLFALKVRIGYIVCIALGFAFVTLFPMALGGRGGLGGDGTPGVTVAASRRVGSYAVETLRATDAKALDAWLSGHGFAGLSAAERLIVDDYIRGSWCFVAARIARGEGGAATPHPILLRFEAAEPVYPLRLTALSGGATELDLFVVAEGATAPGLLRNAFVDRFRWHEDRHSSLWWSDGIGTRIGHPDLKGIFWDGCVVTRLRGTLDPEAMGSDLVMRGETTLEPHRERFYSQRGALSIGAVVFFLVSAFGLLGLSLVIYDCRRAGFGSDPRRDALWALWVLLGAVVVAGTVALALPVREVRMDRQRNPFIYDRFQSRLAWILDGCLHTDMPGDLAATRRRVAEAIAKDWSRPWLEGVDEGERPPLPERLGPAPLELAAPWGYDVREEEGGLKVYLYDPRACPELLWPAP